MHVQGAYHRHASYHKLIFFSDASASRQLYVSEGRRADYYLFFSWVFQVHGTEESACHYKSYKSTHGNAQMHLVYRNFHIAPRHVKRVHLTWTISKVRKVRLSGSDGCLFKFMAQTRGQTITMIIMLSLEIPTTHTNALSDLCMCASPRNPNPCHAQLRLP